MGNKKRTIVIFLGIALAAVCVYAHLQHLGEVKGKAQQLADFTDVPYAEELGEISEDCLYDLDFDKTEDVFWFDRNYPETGFGEKPFIVSFQIGGQTIRLDSYDVKELHSFVIADLNTADRCCDLIVSMTQGADSSVKTSIVNIPHGNKADHIDIGEMIFRRPKTLKANYWHIGEVDSRDRQQCLIDGLYKGIDEAGCLLIGDLRLKPNRDYTLITVSE